MLTIARLLEHLSITMSCEMSAAKAGSFLGHIHHLEIGAASLWLLCRIFTTTIVNGKKYLDYHW